MMFTAKSECRKKMRFKRFNPRFSTVISGSHVQKNLEVSSAELCGNRALVWHSEVCGVLLKVADGQGLVRGWVCLQGGHTRHRSYSPDYV